MTIYIVFLVIFLGHWIADFVLQTDEDAKGKSTSLRHLVSHTSTYSLFWLILITIFYTAGMLHPISLWFPIITFICHTITDYFTSKWVSRLWKEGKTHEFFVVIGFDQLLHYIQLFGTFFILLNLV